MGGTAQMKSRLERYPLALVAPVVHLVSRPACLHQGFIAQFGPFGADDLHGVWGGLVPLPRDGIQGANLLPEAAICQHGIARQQDVQMVVVRLPMEADVHGDLEGIRQPLPEPLSQGGFLVAAEAVRQGRIDLSGHHRIPPPVVRLHAIPEGLPLLRGGACWKDEG